MNFVRLGEISETVGQTSSVTFAALFSVLLLKIAAYVACVIQNPSRSFCAWSDELQARKLYAVHCITFKM